MLEIIGDSHIIALSDATRIGGFSSRHAPIRMAQLGHGYNFLEPFFSADEEKISFTQAPARAMFQKINPELPDGIVKNDDRRFVFMFGLYPSFGFNQENWAAHTTVAWSRDRQFVSESAFNAVIDETLKEPMAFFQALTEMNVRFSVAACCPVPASYQKHAQKSLFSEHEVAFIYNRFRDRGTQRLSSMGIFCHHPPKEVYDDNGAMLDIFAKQPGDYHANPEYGRLMLTKILKEQDELP